MDNKSQWLTTSQVAEITGLSEATLNKARSWKVGAASTLPFCKIGRAVRYGLGDVIKFMDASRVEPGAVDSAR